MGLARLVPQITPYLHAASFLTQIYQARFHVDPAHPLLARLRQLDAEKLFDQALAIALTGLSQEDTRIWINELHNAEEESNDWLLTKLYIHAQTWSAMPGFVQSYLKRNPTKKMISLWLLSSAKYAIFCALCTIIFDMIVRAKVDNYDAQKLEQEKDRLSFELEEEELEHLTIKSMKPYFSWPLRGIALAWAVNAARIYYAHHKRPL